MPMPMLFKVSILQIFSKHHASWCLLALLFPWWEMAASPHELFKSNSKKILANDAIVISDYVFLTGQAQSNSSDQQIGFRKAQLNAYGKLPSYLSGKINYPKSIPERLRPQIFEEYLKLTSLKSSLETGEIVHRNCTENRYTVAVAVPQVKIYAELPSYEQIYSALLSPQGISNPAVRISILLEICERPQDLLSEFARRIQRDYGDNVGAMFSNSITPGFKISSIGKIEKKDYTINELFALLNEVPYHPQLCYELGIKLEADGLPRNAQLLWTCGSISPGLSKEYADKCRRKLPKKPLFSFANPIGLDLIPFKKYLAQSVPPLNDLAGKIPGGKAAATDADYQAGLNAFQANNLPDAYEYFCKSISENVSFDACNMAGNTARRIGKCHEAVALLLQAAAIDLQSPYPWVNLALTFDILQKNDMTDYCIKQAEKRHLDDWSKQQIKHLKSK